MPALAMSGSRSHSSLCILRRRYWLKMVWVDAAMIPAQMVNCQTHANLADEAFIRPPVGASHDPAHLEQAIPILVLGATPFPTSRIRPFNRTLETLDVS